MDLFSALPVANSKKMGKSLLSPILFTLTVWTAFLPPFLISASWIFAAEFTDRIVAIVNKDVITMSDLQAELEDERKRLRARYRGEELSRRLAQKEYQALNALIEHKVQVDEAKAKGFSVTEAEVARALQTVSSGQLGQFSSKSDLKRRIVDQLLLDKLWDFEIRRTVMVPDSEITKYYEEHTDQYLVPPTYKLRQILLITRSEQDEADRRSRAESISQAIRANGDFAALALKYSEGPEATEGGILGVVRQDELLEPIAEALKTMSPGEISRPIKTSLGYHIIALDEVTEPRARPLEEVENDIKTFLYKKRTDETFQRWLADLKKKAFIEIKF